MYKDRGDNVRLYIRNNVLELIQTINEGVQYVLSHQNEETDYLLEDCLFGVTGILNILEEQLSENRYKDYEFILNEIKTTLTAMQEKETITNVNPIFLFEKIKKMLKNEDEIKLEILFLPYKSSMWDSLESIWKSAKVDTRCNCVVMPIPYYEKNPRGESEKMVYEGNQFPKEVPITHYSNYDIAQMTPDVIYIHNPYDGYNMVTGVLPQYYSEELKKHTDMLVYVPYFIAGTYLNLNNAANKILLPSIKNHVDKVIVQNEALRKLYIKCGISPKKVLALGSPKIDSAISLSKSKINIPDDWIEKIKDRKVFLLNLTIGTLLANDIWLSIYAEIIKTFSEDNEVVLIWRPHPLLESTIKSMRPHLYEQYKSLLYRVKAYDNVILDFEDSSDIAVSCSDALVSDYSSLIFKYTATGKPTCVLTKNPKGYDKEKKIFLGYTTFEYYENYFWYSDEEIWKIQGFQIEGYAKYMQEAMNGTYGVRRILLKEYIEMIKQGKDPKKIQRIKVLKKSVANADGTSGKKIHEYIIKNTL